jgi:hypothetical protein
VRGRTLLGATALLISCLGAAGVVAGQTGGVGTTSLAARTAAVAKTVEVSQQFILVLGTGLVLGLGLGMILGSVSVYKYWERALSSEHQ